MSSVNQQTALSNWDQTEGAKAPMYRLTHCALAAGTSAGTTFLITGSGFATCAAGVLATAVTWFKEHSPYTKDVSSHGFIAGLAVSLITWGAEVKELRESKGQPLPPAIAQVQNFGNYFIKKEGITKN
jgi:hypothetical protein